MQPQLCMKVNLTTLQPQLGIMHVALVLSTCWELALRYRCCYQPCSKTRSAGWHMMQETQPALTVKPQT